MVSRNKSRILFSITILSFLFAASCGMPTVTYLYPPAMDLNNTVLRVENNPLNYESSEGSTQTYRGIEIYYRIYQDSLSADNATSALTNEIDYYSTDPEGFLSLAAGNSYKFVRLRYAQSYSGTPLIPLSANDANGYYIQLFPSQSVNWQLTDAAGNPLGTTDKSTIIRSLVTSSSNTSFYNKIFMPGDEDYAGTAGSPSDTYFIAFFAISYGKDSTTIGLPVYSLPEIVSYVAY
ncbi:MAG: hypothetical protein WC820_06110 [Spirochaetales bacterium]|jgi:hypothetical protein